MNVGIRGKLFFGSILLIALVGLASAIYLERRLRDWTETRVEAELERHARAAKILIEDAPGLEPDTADGWCDQLGSALGARVTLIEATGRVLGDSEVSPRELDLLESHHTRPEIVAALQTGIGSARRHSSTVETDMMYVAVRYQRVESTGVVRIAMPLSEVEEAIWTLRIMLLLTGIFGLIAAVLMSGLASHLLSRTLRELVFRTQALSSGTGARAAPDVAGSFHRVAEELEATVKALAHQRDRFESVLESLSEAVIALDGEGRITLVNPAALSLLGLPLPCTGKKLGELIAIPELLELAAAGPGDRRDAVEFELTAGVRRWLLARAAPQRAGAGTVMVVHDVTEIRRLEAIRRDFVANVSHELRTPVSIIRANAETLLDGALEDREHARQFAGAILRHSERLANLISDLLDLSRIEAGRYPLELEDLPVDATLERIVELFSSAASAKNITLTAEAPFGLQVRGDAGALEQVLSNLVGNAVKYTPPGGRVEIRARSLGGEVRLEVADDGNGIEPRHRERVFQRFYRVDKGRSRDEGGTGLGLAIVKHLMEAMRGTVGLEPNTPRGSIFWVVLPSARS